MRFFGREGVDGWKGIWWKEVVAPWALRHPLRRPTQKHGKSIDWGGVDDDGEMRV